jgi:hypothetical protein
MALANVRYNHQQCMALPRYVNGIFGLKPLSRNFATQHLPYELVPSELHAAVRCSSISCHSCVNYKKRTIHLLDHLHAFDRRYAATYIVSVHLFGSARTMEGNPLQHVTATISFNNTISTFLGGEANEWQLELLTSRSPVLHAAHECNDNIPLPLPCHYINLWLASVFCRTSWAAMSASELGILATVRWPCDVAHLCTLTQASQKQSIYSKYSDAPKLIVSSSSRSNLRRVSCIFSPLSVEQ